MSISPEQIDLWRGLVSETQRLEFKEARNQYDTTKLCRYCVAIANEGGGHLVLGIADKPPRPVVAVKLSWTRKTLPRSCSTGWAFV